MNQGQILSAFNEVLLLEDTFSYWTGYVLYNEHSQVRQKVNSTSRPEETGSLFHCFMQRTVIGYQKVGSHSFQSCFRRRSSRSQRTSCWDSPRCQSLEDDMTCDRDSSAKNVHSKLNPLSECSWYDTPYQQTQFSSIVSISTSEHLLPLCCHWRLYDI